MSHISHSAVLRAYQLWFCFQVQVCGRQLSSLNAKKGLGPIKVWGR